MTQRPITFPKIREGYYRNAETGVHAFKVKGGYLPATENRYGTSVPITDSPCTTLKQARSIMTRVALGLREANGEAYVEAVAEDAERIVEQDGRPAERAPQFAEGDAVVFTDPDNTGIDTDTVWRIEKIWGADTEYPHADLIGHSYPSMASASYFHRLAPAPRCTAADGWLSEHEFEYNPAEVEAVRAGNDGYDEYERCEKLRSDVAHHTDRARAAATIHAARDHEGVPAGKPYGGEWPGTTVIESSARAIEHAEAAGFRPGFYRLDVAPQGDTETIGTMGSIGAGKSELTPQAVERALAAGYSARVVDPKPTTPGHPACCSCGECGFRRQHPAVPADASDEAWAEYVAALPPAEPEAVAEVAVEFSSWTSHRANAVEGFRNAFRALQALRAEGLALPGSEEYRLMRGSMQHFREVIHLCDRQNAALRREIAATS